MWTVGACSQASTHGHTSNVQHEAARTAKSAAHTHTRTESTIRTVTYPKLGQCSQVQQCRAPVSTPLPHPWRAEEDTRRWCHEACCALSRLSIACVKQCRPSTSARTVGGGGGGWARAHHRQAACSVRPQPSRFPCHFRCHASAGQPGRQQRPAEGALPGRHSFRGQARAGLWGGATGRLQITSRFGLPMPHCGACGRLWTEVRLRV